jgi:hypothetical protein
MNLQSGHIRTAKIGRCSLITYNYNYSNAAFSLEKIWMFMANISAVGWVKLNQPISRAGGRWRGGNNFKAERMGGLLPWVTITNKHGEVI